MPDKHLTSRETATAEPSCRRFAAYRVMGHPCTAGSRPQLHPAAALAAEHKAVISRHPSSVILHPPLAPPPPWFPNPKPISHIQVCGSGGTSPSPQQRLPCLSVSFRGFQPKAHQSHPGLRLGWNLALPENTIPFRVFRGSITSVSIRVHPWFQNDHRSAQHRTRLGWNLALPQNTNATRTRLGWNLALPEKHKRNEIGKKSGAIHL